MEMPRPNQHHEKLTALAGTWTGEEKIHPSPWDPAGGGATGRIVSRMDLDGFFLVSDYVEERGGQVAYRGHGVFGYDPERTCYTMHWFDSIGSGVSEPARGQWEGNALVFKSRSPMGHARYTYTLEAEGRYTFRIDHSEDGERWVPFMEGTYKRA